MVVATDHSYKYLNSFGHIHIASQLPFVTMVITHTHFEKGFSRKRIVIELDIFGGGGYLTI